MLRSRTTIAGFFILLMLIPICWFSALQLRQVIVQHEMMEKLEHAELETLSIPVSELKWYKKNKEIIVNHQLFDVKSIRINNGVAEIKGLFDVKEHAIKKALSASGDHQRTGKLAGKFITLVLLHRFHSIHSPENTVLLRIAHCMPLKSFYNAPFRELVFPPPRL